MINLDGYRLRRTLYQNDAPYQLHK